MSQLLKFVPLEPVVHNKRSRCSEKLAHCHWRTAPTYHNYRKPRHSDKDPEQPKIKFKKTFKNRGPWFWNLEKESFLIKLNKNSVGGKNDLPWCKAVDCLFFITLGFISLAAEQRIIYTQSAALLRALWNNLILPPFEKSGLWNSSGPRGVKCEIMDFSYY